jgi:hypothetical protein
MQIVRYILFILLAVSTGSAQNWNEGYEVKSGWHILGIRDPGIRMARLEKNPALFEFATEVAAFYLDEPELLASFVSEMMSGEAHSKPCYGVDYQIYLCDGYRPVFTFSLNLECELLYFGLQSFHFPSDSITAWQNRFKIPVSRKLDFTTLDKARTGFPELEKKEGLLLAIPPDWLRFDGVVLYEIHCAENETACFEQRMQKMNSLKAQIQADYPDAPLEIRIDGGSKSYVRYAIYTNSLTGSSLSASLQAKWSPFRTYYLNTWWDY